MALRPTSSCFWMILIDLAVLDLLELGRGYLTLLALGARLLDRRGAQDRADMVGAEWRLGSL